MVSVIIPTLNAGSLIRDSCAALSAQSTATEIIVIDSASTDDTVAIARSCGAKTISIGREEFDHGATRNRASREAEGEMLVFMTQDALPASERCLESLVKPLEEPEIAAAYARQIPRPDAAPPEQFTRLFNYPGVSSVKNKERIPELGVRTFFFSDACSAIRKSVFEEMGGFPERLIMDEDLLFAAKLILKGYSVAYVAEAQVYHSHSYHWWRQFKRYFDTGVFFRDNPWLLGYARVDGEGRRFVREEFKYLLSRRAYHWIPYIVGELFCKYAGYKLGLRYVHLPNAWRQRMSLHRHYWTNR